MRQSTTFEAHQSPILKMSMNYGGNRLVTASCKGTIIRVFSLPKGNKLFSLKRGSSNCMIYSLNFSRAGGHVLLSSENGSIHVFKLPTKDGDDLDENDDSMQEDFEESENSMIKDEVKE
jgi:autophagy-related protein 18